jgi:hypothetical protein
MLGIASSQFPDDSSDFILNIGQRITEIDDGAIIEDSFDEGLKLFSSEKEFLFL